MTCLYADDYGPPVPGFDPGTAGRALAASFPAHAAELAQAHNAGQLAAMARVLQRGGEVEWCDQGYGWTESAAADALFAGIVAFVILPYLAWRLGFGARLGALASRRRMPGSSSSLPAPR